MTEEEIKAIAHQLIQELKHQQVNVVEEMLDIHSREQNEKMRECQTFVENLRTEQGEISRERRALKYRIIFWSITSFVTIIAFVIGYAFTHWLQR